MLADSVPMAGGAHRARWSSPPRVLGWESTRGCPESLVHAASSRRVPLCIHTERSFEGAVRAVRALCTSSAIGDVQTRRKCRVTAAQAAVSSFLCIGPPFVFNGNEQPLHSPPLPSGEWDRHLPQKLIFFGGKKNLPLASGVMLYSIVFGAR